MRRPPFRTRPLMHLAIPALLALGVVMVSNGCEPTNRVLMNTPGPAQLRLEVADPTYRLSDADRAKLLPNFDAEALERLLAMTRPERRQDILKPFQVRENGERLGHLVGLEDAELQKLLEEVWAPMWDHVGATDADIEANLYGWPGREVAKQRRAARARAKQDGSE